jgi:hypothetical protein
MRTSQNENIIGEFVCCFDKSVSDFKDFTGLEVGFVVNLEEV